MKKLHMSEQYLEACACVVVERASLEGKRYVRLWHPAVLLSPTRRAFACGPDDGGCRRYNVQQAQTPRASSPLGRTLSVGLYAGVSHGHHPVCPAVVNRRLPLRSGNDRLWFRSRRLCRTTLSARTAGSALCWEAVGRCPYCRDDWVLHCPVDGLFRGQRPPVPRLEGASDTHILGAAHRHRASVPGSVPLPFRTENRQARATRSSIARREIMERIERMD